MLGHVDNQRKIVFISRLLADDDEYIVGIANLFPEILINLRPEKDKPVLLSKR
jgi:hypothetical protein